jgi:DNA invertase Pin-like site-specific DNA recombinase
MNKAKRYIAYYRVSTDRQGESGLGLEAQRHIVSQFLGAEDALLAEYTEVESGKRNDRPTLQEALLHCRREKATLLIAKLDRLGRNLAFIASLMDSGVDFIAADNPHANRLMLHMLAVFAEHEALQISLRTKQALQAAKARGTLLGENAKPLHTRNSTRADEFAARLAPQIHTILAAGHCTLRQIADALNTSGIPPMRGNKWHPPSVSNLLTRLHLKTGAVSYAR